MSCGPQFTNRCRLTLRDHLMICFTKNMMQMGLWILSVFSHARPWSVCACHDLGFGAQGWSVRWVVNLWLALRGSKPLTTLTTLLLGLKLRVYVFGAECACLGQKGEKPAWSAFPGQKMIQTHYALRPRHHGGTLRATRPSTLSLTTMKLETYIQSSHNTVKVATWKSVILQESIWFHQHLHLFERSETPLDYMAALVTSTMGQMPYNSRLRLSGLNLITEVALSGQRLQAQHAWRGGREGHNCRFTVSRGGRGSSHYYAVAKRGCETTDGKASSGFPSLYYSEKPKSNYNMGLALAPGKEKSCRAKGPTLLQCANRHTQNVTCFRRK